MKIWSTVSHKGYPHHISGSRSRVRGYDWSEQLSKDKVYALFKTLHHTFERRLTFDNSFDQIVLERLVSIEVSKTGVSNNEKKRFVEDITKECNKVLKNPTVLWFLHHQFSLVYVEPLEKQIHSTICFEKEDYYYYLHVCHEITDLNEMNVKLILGGFEDVNPHENNALDSTDSVHFAVYCVKSHDIRWIGN